MISHQDPFGIGESTAYALIFALVLTLMLTFMTCEPAHGSTASKKSNTTCWLPEGCVTQYQENPFTYKAGTVSTVGAPDDAIVIRIQPLATYSLFTEDILFCDADRVALLGSGKHNPVLLTYKTKASHMVQGIGCHDLVRVDEFKEAKQ